jgi:hypothetical protein
MNLDEITEPRPRHNRALPAAGSVAEVVAGLPPKKTSIAVKLDTTGPATDAN